jgi:hypothetical protein
MKNLTAIAYLVGSLVVVGCSGGDSSQVAPPSDPTATLAPLRAASAQYINDATALRDQLQASSNGDPSVVAPGHRLVKIAKIHARAVDQIELLMQMSIDQRNGVSSGAITTKNTGGGSGGSAGSGSSGSGSGSGSGGSGGSDGKDTTTTGDSDIDSMDDDMNNMDDNLDKEDDDLNPTDGSGDGSMSDPGSSGSGKSGSGSGSGSGAGKSGSGSGGSGAGKPSGGSGSGGGKPGAGGTPSGGDPGAALSKLLDKLMKMLEKASASPGQAKGKTGKADPDAVLADLTQLYKLLNDPVFKKWAKFGAK